MRAIGPANPEGLSVARPRSETPNFGPTMRPLRRPHRCSMDWVIERLGHAGDGIASGPIYAPRALPGERVTGDLSGSRLTNLKVLEPSEARIKPTCKHYNTCGGCALQHAHGDFVADWKRAVVSEALAARGISVDVLGPETSPAHSRRRAAFTGRRTKKGAIVGFHGRASGQITGVPECQVLAPALVQALPHLEALVRLAASRNAEVKLQVTVGDTGVDLAVEGAKPLDGPMQAALAPFAANFARITWNGEVALQTSAPGVHFGAARVVPPPGAFLQATAAGEAALTQVVMETLRGARNILDLFSGCGTFTFPAAEIAPVHAVEGAQDLIDALDSAVRHTQGLKAITTEVRDLFRNPLIPEDLALFDAAIVDPPRAGAEAQVRELTNAQISRIAMVSCNPVTFSRDVDILINAGYRLGPVQVVDQFRWSPHIELVAGLTKDV